MHKAIKIAGLVLVGTTLAAAAKAQTLDWSVDPISQIQPQLKKMSGKTRFMNQWIAFDTYESANQKCPGSIANGIIMGAQRMNSFLENILLSDAANASKKRVDYIEAFPYLQVRGDNSVVVKIGLNKYRPWIDEDIDDERETPDYAFTELRFNPADGEIMDGTATAAVTADGEFLMRNGELYSPALGETFPYNSDAYVGQQFYLMPGYGFEFKIVPAADAGKEDSLEIAFAGFAGSDSDSCSGK
ncbi:MAG: hypothetical protein ACYCPQ_05475 [Elusimicrobiota bacterium]